MATQDKRKLSNNDSKNKFNPSNKKPFNNKPPVNANKAKKNSFKKLDGDADQKVEKNKNFKAKLRDTERLLKRPNLSAEVRVEMERKKKALILQIKQTEEDKIAEANRLKYKYVMFLEKKKALRKIKNLEKKIEENEEEAKLLTFELELMEANVDLNYILHFPLTEKYISLYPTVQVENNKALENNSDRKSEIREHIKKQMLEGSLLSQPTKYSTALPKDSENLEVISSKVQTKAVPLNDDFFTQEDGENSQSESEGIEKTAQEDDKVSDDQSDDNSSDNEDLSSEGSEASDEQ